MKSRLLLGAGILLIFSLAGCARASQSRTQADMQETISGEVQEETQGMTEKEQQDAENVYHKISAEEAKEKMETEDVTIVDVRTLQEYREGHVPEAVNIPNEEIGESEPELLSDKDAVLLIYCRSGRRSREAAEKLVKLGYSRVYDFGGIIDWTYETVKEE